MDRVLFVYQPHASSFEPAFGKTAWEAFERNHFDQLPLLLGLDYAVVAFDQSAGEVWLSRGGVGRTGLFWRWDGSDLVIDDNLPALALDEDVDATAFAAFIANGASPVPNDIVHTPTTLLAKRGWQRVVRSSVVHIAVRSKQLTIAHYQLPEDEPYRDLSESDLIAAYRDAIVRHFERRATGQCAVELSGGIDSSIVASVLEQVVPRGGHFGVSLTYPYYEFRHERRYIDAVNTRLGWTPVLLDGSRTLLFDSADAEFDTAEPTRLASGFAQLSAVTHAALQGEACVLFSGHGADQIFGMSPYDRRTLFKPDISLDLLRGALAADVRDHMSMMQRIHEEGDSRGHRHFFSALMLYDRWVPTPAPGRLVCDPGLLSVDTLRLSWEVFRRPRWKSPGYPGKPFAREAFADWLPEIVCNRRWKVGYDGLYRRGLARNADELIAKLTRQREHLEALGVDSARCVERLERCKAFHFDHTELLIAILSYCVWRETKNASLEHRPIHATLRSAQAL